MGSDSSADTEQPSTIFPTVEGVPPKGYVDYPLVWERSNLELSNGYWRTRSNRGYEITITAGWLSNYSISLSACPEVTLNDYFPLSIQRAYANDSAMIDTSHSMTGLAENLTQFNDQVWSQRPLSNHVYCKLHHLIARADEKVLKQPSDARSGPTVARPQTSTIHRTEKKTRAIVTRICELGIAVETTGT